MGKGTMQIGELKNERQTNFFTATFSFSVTANPSSTKMEGELGPSDVGNNIGDEVP